MSSNVIAAGATNCCTVMTTLTVTRVAALAGLPEGDTSL